MGTRENRIAGGRRPGQARTTNKGNAGTASKHAYESTVKVRALARAGKNPNLHGHIQEIMAADKTNFNPFNGLKETLTKSTTAKTVDAVVRNSKGVIVKRVQYKDIKDVSKLIRQCKAGKYKTVTLKGSPETAKAFNAAAKKLGLAKRMESTGVSSKTTTSLAKSCGAGHAGALSKAMAHSAKDGAWAGGTSAGFFSSLTNLYAVVNDDKDEFEAVMDVVKDAGIGTVSGAAAAASATAAGAATASALTAWGVTGVALTTTTVALPFVAAVAVGWAVSSFFAELLD